MTDEPVPSTQDALFHRGSLGDGGALLPHTNTLLRREALHEEGRHVGDRRAGSLMVVALAAGALLFLSVPGAVATNDRFFAQQWNLAQVGAPDAWATSTGAGC